MFPWRSLTVARHPSSISSKSGRQTELSHVTVWSISFSVSLEQVCKRDLLLKGLHDEDVGSARSEASSWTLAVPSTRPFPMLDESGT